MKQSRERIVMQGDQAQLVFDLGGGGIVGFCLTNPQLTANGLTPLAWNTPGEDDLEPREMAHFVVLDRWGNPTEAEARNGMTFNGEATHVQWRVTQAPETRDGVVKASVATDLPLAGLTLNRTMCLTGTVLQIEERLTSRNAIGRPFNMIEHATIGPPFLDEEVVVDTKVKQGFTQEFELRTPTPEEPVVSWPNYIYNGHEINMRRLHDIAGPLVTSFIFDDEQENAWVTACNPSKELMIGYLWKTQDFPWLNLWRHVVDGHPMARGMEIGTTGLIQPFPVLAKKRQIFDRQLFEWIDAGETIIKHLTAFLAPVPADFRGVTDVQQADGVITVTEYGDAPRTLTVGETAGVLGR